jgi:hypothetical protein
VFNSGLTGVKPWFNMAKGLTWIYLFTWKPKPRVNLQGFNPAGINAASGLPFVTQGSRGWAGRQRGSFLQRNVRPIRPPINQRAAINARGDPLQHMHGGRGPHTPTPAAWRQRPARTPVNAFTIGVVGGGPRRWYSPTTPEGTPGSSYVWGDRKGCKREGEGVGALPFFVVIQKKSL